MSKSNKHTLEKQQSNMLQTLVPLWQHNKPYWEGANLPPRHYTDTKLITGECYYVSIMSESVAVGERSSLFAKNRTDAGHYGFKMRPIKSGPGGRRSWLG